MNELAVIEITNISIHGIWLYVKGKEYFLPYEDYPWFKDARLSEIQHVQLLHEDHLYWPNSISLLHKKHQFI
jgi:hypothetical protein